MLENIIYYILGLLVAFITIGFGWVSEYDCIGLRLTRNCFILSGGKLHMEETFSAKKFLMSHS